MILSGSEVNTHAEIRAVLKVLAYPSQSYKFSPIYYPLKVLNVTNLTCRCTIKIGLYETLLSHIWHQRLLWCSKKWNSLPNLPLQTCKFMTLAGLTKKVKNQMLLWGQEYLTFMQNHITQALIWMKTYAYQNHPLS